METNGERTLDGVVVYLPSNEGSKSEAVLPFLYQGKALAPVRLFRENDNPFENTGFSDCDGKRVEVRGMFERGVFVVKESRMI